MMYEIFLILSWLCLCCANSFNILAICPHSGKSHFMAFEPLLKNLSKKGHNVTVISYFPQDIPIPNYRDVSLQIFRFGVEEVSIDDMIRSRLTHYFDPLAIASIGTPNCLSGLQTPKLKEFLKEDNSFDVVLVEMFNTNCYMGLTEKYNAPFIGLSSCTAMPWSNDWLGNPSHPAYIPNVFMDYSDQLSFLERLENTLIYFYTRIIYKYTMEIPGNELSKQYLGWDLLGNGNIMYNISLLLANTHFSLNLPRPLVPAFVEVGGIHVGIPKKLPSNLEKWINESPEGVIYFSLGSLIKAKTLPKDKVNLFFKVFERLPQRVLWKWEDDTMEEQPNNVMTQKWMPQFDVLCHPNVKAFISHGGLLGTIEATHCGVPMMIMPQYGDQFVNARAMETRGTGIMIKFNDVTEQKVYEMLKTILKKDFRQNAKKQAEIFKDRPMPPMETAIYWIEYVAKYRGARHMRTAAVDMPFYKYYLLDVACSLLVIFFLFLYISYRTFNIICARTSNLISGKVKKS